MSFSKPPLPPFRQCPAKLQENLISFPPEGKTERQLLCIKGGRKGGKNRRKHVRARYITQFYSLRANPCIRCECDELCTQILKWVIYQTICWSGTFPPSVSKLRSPKHRARLKGLSRSLSLSLTRSHSLAQSSLHLFLSLSFLSNEPSAITIFSARYIDS